MPTSPCAIQAPFRPRIPSNSFTDGRMPQVHPTRHLQFRGHCMVQPFSRHHRSRTHIFASRNASCPSNSNKCWEESADSLVSNLKPLDVKSTVSKCMATLPAAFLIDLFNTTEAFAEEGPGVSDTVASVLFAVATLALVLLTLGVAYLSLATWLDQRQEASDIKESGPKSQYEEDMARYQGKLSKKQKKKNVSKATAKGFGKD